VSDSVCRIQEKKCALRPKLRSPGFDGGIIGGVV
jgi:hypothetical protein